MALIVTLRGSNYRCLEQIFMVPKGFEPSKFDYLFLLNHLARHYWDRQAQTNSIDLDQMLQNAASDLSLHGLPLIK